MIRRFRKDENGSVMVEMTISIVLLLMLTLGFVDFGHAYYQWNAAAKAVQVGARLASISDPVATNLTGAGPTDTPGAPVEAGDFAAFVCTSAGGGTCGGFSAANFSRIFRGDTAFTNDDACPDIQGSQRPGMCHFFPGLRRASVRITYSASGLGYQTRPDGPVPTITVSLQNVSFRFFFLGGLLGFNNIAMPSMLSTVTGEDMKSTAP
ncbi:TadE/TadG family type IV pilus assembly protein [Mesorhizobium sp. KR9-304]|uniref:TadE/TadG family type IV pilus assembly protein n=1 Tax=Mesorhizobium sp. KR9-304 TaxID=3156614 RepID=UPI0032B30FC6